MVMRREEAVLGKAGKTRRRFAKHIRKKQSDAREVRAATIVCRKVRHAER